MKTKTRIFPQIIAVAAAATFTINFAPAAELEGDQRSAHFDAVSAHLDLGGEIYAYIDIDGDFDKLASIGQDFLEMAKKEARGEMPPQLASLDLRELADDIGLSGIGAMGMSSYKQGDLYRNSYYLHVPGGRKGFLKAFGGEAAPFATRGLAPAGSDIVFEQDLDLKSAFDLVEGLALKLGGKKAAREFRREMTQPGGPGGLSVADIFDHLDTKLIMVGEVHPDKPMKLPTELPAKIPGVDLFISFDGIGPVFAKLTEAIPPAQRAQLIKVGDGFEEMSVPMPPEMAGIMQPVIRHETASGRVIMATSSAYLVECVSGATSVWDDEGFKSAMSGLPEEGNGLTFVSAKLMKEYVRIYRDMFEATTAQGGMPAGVGEKIVGLMVELGMNPNHSQGRVTVNLPEGILIKENSAASAKQTVAAAGAGFMLGLFGTYASRMDAANYEEDFLFEEATPAPPKATFER